MISGEKTLLKCYQKAYICGSAHLKNPSMEKESMTHQPLQDEMFRTLTNEWPMRQKKLSGGRLVVVGFFFINVANKGHFQ